MNEKVDSMPEMTVEPPALYADSLRTRTLKAGVWSLAGYAGSQAARLGSSMLLTRLLFPEAFGVMALVWAYLTGLVMFSDVGLGGYLFQSNKANDRRFHDAIWSIGIVRGGIVLAAAAMLAFPMARLYRQPDLVPMLLVSAAGQFFLCFGATNLITARRDLKQKELALFGLAVQLLTTISTLAFAWWLRSAWALVLGSVIGAFSSMVGSQCFFPGPRNRWRWDLSIVREVRGFSVWVYISSIMTFFGSQADRLILGKLMPMDFLGIYGIAMTLALIPLALVQQGGGLLSPILVQLRHGADPAIERKLQEARGVLLRFGAVLAAATCVAAPAFFGFLYDPRYAMAGVIGSALVFSVWTGMLESSAGGLTLAFGDAKSTAICSLGRMLGGLSGAAVGYFVGGVYGFIVGVGMGPLAVYALSVILLRKHGIRIGREDARYSATLALLAGFGWSVVVLLPWLSPRVTKPMASVVASILVVSVGLTCNVSAIREFVAMCRGKRGYAAPA